MFQVMYNVTFAISQSSRGWNSFTIYIVSYRNEDGTSIQTMNGLLNIVTLIDYVLLNSVVVEPKKLFTKNSVM